MATEDELSKWSKEKRSPSPRHRGRKRRKQRKPKVRRKAGDKSKNAKVAMSKAIGLPHRTRRVRSEHAKDGVDTGSLPRGVAAFWTSAKLEA